MRGFLSVTKWEPNFIRQDSMIRHTVIWIKLPQLPVEFYDKQVLEKIRQKLGALLKIDSCSSSTLKGRHASICIQVPLELPVKRSVTIGDHVQEVEYEGEGTLCMGCGRLGHTLKSYISNQPRNLLMHLVLSETSPPKSMWKIVNFLRKRAKRNLRKENLPLNSRTQKHILTQVKVLDAYLGKFINSSK